MKFYSYGCLSRGNFGRAPQGARGLKWQTVGVELVPVAVAPRKGRVG